MTDLSLFIVDSRCTLLDVTRAISANHCRCVVVVTDNKVVGVVSEGDLLRAFLRGTDIHSSVEPFINHGFHFLLKRDMLKALDVFISHGVSLIPILSSEFELQDVITLPQLLDSFRINTISS